MHTPGHTPGGICLKVSGEPVVFTGDTVFMDDVGRTDLNGGSESQLKTSLRHILTTWQDDWVLYPGHDGSGLMKEARPFLEKIAGSK
jgi:glyoxylase-like metal-dependent hydrolase (beta-lactamase superfamily II)